MQPKVLTVVDVAPFSVRSVLVIITLCVAIGGATSYVAEAYSLQFGLAIALYLWVSIVLARRLGALDPRVIFFVSASVYSTAGSFDFYAFQDSGGFGEVANATFLWLGFLFMVPAAILLVGVSRDTRPIQPLPIKRGSLAALGLASIVLLAAYVAQSAYTFAPLAGQLDRATVVTQQGTLAAVVRNILVAFVLVWTWAILNFQGARLSVWASATVVVCLLGFDIFFLHERRVVVGMLLGLFYLTLNRNRLMPLFLAPIAIIFLGLLVFAAVRELPTSLWYDALLRLDLWRYLSPVNLDFGGFPLIASDILASSTQLIGEAPTYADGLLATTPHWILPGRPSSFSIWYVQTYHPEVAYVGGGFASNWVIESYINFGLPGCVLVGIVTATLLNALCSSRSAYAHLRCAAALPSFAFLMRLDLTSFLQVFGLITLLAIALSRFAVTRPNGTHASVSDSGVVLPSRLA